jgi:hypothetical protein
VVFEDETGFSLHPRLGRIWGKKGTKSYIYTRSQHQKRLNLFGWVDPINGFHGVMKWVRGNTDGFLTHTVSGAWLLTFGQTTLPGIRDPV